MVTLKDKIDGLKLIWGEDIVREAQSYAWEYAVAEAGYLGLYFESTTEEEKRRGLALIARIRTVETVDSMIEKTKGAERIYEEVIGEKPNRLTMIKHVLFIAFHIHQLLIRILMNSVPFFHIT